MPESTKTFTYTVDGLSYTVTLREEGDTVLADITVDEGAMDVNAIYFGDDDHTGESADLGKALNMNGGGSTTDDGSAVQWDDAVAISEPGLGDAGTEKQTYLQQGDTLTLELSDVTLDDIDVFGIRATSTTTEEGSIKAVSDDPVDEPDEPEDPEEPLYEKVFFGSFNEDGGPETGTYIRSEPDDWGTPVLPEDQEPTFENYLAFYEDRGGDVTGIEGIAFYEADEDGNTVETFRIEAPEGGFFDSAEVLAAYDAALEALETEDPDAMSGDTLIAALSLPDSPDDEPAEPEADDAELVEAV